MLFYTSWYFVAAIHLQTQLKIQSRLIFIFYLTMFKQKSPTAMCMVINPSKKA